MMAPAPAPATAPAPTTAPTRVTITLQDQATKETFTAIVFNRTDCTMVIGTPNFLVKRLFRYGRIDGHSVWRNADNDERFTEIG